MPSRTPSADLNTSVVVKLDPASTPFGFNPGQLTPGLMRALLARADEAGEVGPLYDIYERMEATDTMYGGLTDQLKSAVAGFKIKVRPAPTTTEADRKLADEYAEVGREVMSGLNQHAVTRGFCAPHFLGVKGYLLTWHLKSLPYGRRMWMPKTVQPVRGRHLAVERNTESPTYGEIGLRAKGEFGIRAFSTLPPESYILLETDDAHDRYASVGAARKCVPWYLGIQYVQSRWVSYIESYGSPLRIGRYPRGTGKETKAELARFLQTLGNEGYALFPNDMELILQEANRQGTVTTYQDFIRMGHSQYAIALLGQADTVGGKSEGGYARSVVANSIRYEVLQEVGSYVGQGWETLVGHAIRANYGPDADERLFPEVRPVIITPQEMTAKTTTFTTLQAAGVPISEDYPFEQILGSEPPRDGEYVYAHGQRFRFNVDPFPEASTAPDTAVPSTRQNRDGDAPEGSRSVANDPREANEA